MNPLLRRTSISGDAGQQPGCGVEEDNALTLNWMKFQTHLERVQRYAHLSAPQRFFEYTDPGSVKPENQYHHTSKKVRRLVGETGLLPSDIAALLTAHGQSLRLATVKMLSRRRNPTNKQTSCHSTSTVTQRRAVLSASSSLALRAREPDSRCSHSTSAQQCSSKSVNFRCNLQHQCNGLEPKTSSFNGWHSKKWVRSSRVSRWYGSRWSRRVWTWWRNSQTSSGRTANHRGWTARATRHCKMIIVHIWNLNVFHLFRSLQISHVDKLHLFGSSAALKATIQSNLCHLRTPHEVLNAQHRPK